MDTDQPDVPPRADHEDNGYQHPMLAKARSLSGLEDHLKERIIGQDLALKQIAKAVHRGELGLRDKPGQVKGVYLFLGSTGVGKTETTLCLARYLYGETEERMHRFDMAEHQTESSLGLLLGRNRDEQGILGDAIDRLNARGGGFLLFDEIEKASKPLVQVFLGIMDAARVSMSTGEVKHLENIYLVFTSNLGTAESMMMENMPYSGLKRHVLHVAQEFFGPPIMGRFQEKIVFRRLTHDVQIAICEQMLKKEFPYFANVAGCRIEADRSVFPFILKRGYDRLLGARPMKEAIDREVGNAITEWAMSHSGQHPVALRLRGETDKIVAEAVV